MRVTGRKLSSILRRDSQKQIGTQWPTVHLCDNLLDGGRLRGLLALSGSVGTTCHESTQVTMFLMGHAGHGRFPALACRLRVNQSNTPVAKFPF